MRPQAATDLGPGPTVQAEPWMDGAEPAKPQNTRGTTVYPIRRAQRQLQRPTTSGRDLARVRTVQGGEQG